MKRFNVHVCRTAVRHTTMTVLANTEEEATQKALCKAADHGFGPESEAEYSVEGICPLWPEPSGLSQETPASPKPYLVEDWLY